MTVFGRQPVPVISKWKVLKRQSDMQKCTGLNLQKLLIVIRVINNKQKLCLDYVF